ncbi:MAG: cupin domain-containing protein [Chloroflexota bacterium]|jgi:mannose-6-phosphate isomerase-like protein (cupin superfamily)
MFVKVAPVQGEFVWHSHEDEDELFFILRGKLRIELDDSLIDLDEGDLAIIPKGRRHRPVATEECHILLIERQSTLHTGNDETELTRSIAEQLSR